MSFHAKQQAVTNAMAKTLEQHPHLEARIRELDEHYMLGGLEKPSPMGLYAAVRLHIDKDYQAVASHLSRTFQQVIGQAESHLINAVNHGPAFLKGDEEFLHGKGIMRGVDRYYLGYKGIHQGGTYDRAWQALDPAHRPIIAEALTAAVSQKQKTMEKRVLKYVAVLLMPEGVQKDFMLSKLSIKSEKKHGPYVREASDFIRRKSNDLGINVSETLLANKAADRKILPRIPAPLSSPHRAQVETKPVRPEFTGGANAPKEKEAFAASEQNNEPTRDMVKLKRVLKELERRGKISEKEGKIYFWLENGSDEEPRTMEDAAKKSGKKTGEIRIIVAKINVALRQIERDNINAPSSDANLHKAGAVRPK